MRSVSCVTEPSWSSLSREVGEEVGGASVGATDLVQLMKSLDISSEHMQSLKVPSVHCIKDVDIVTACIRGLPIVDTFCIISYEYCGLPEVM